MELDFTAQLQPALWGLFMALVVSVAGLAAVADRDEIELLRPFRELRNHWRHRRELARKLGHRFARTLHLLPRTSR